MFYLMFTIALLFVRGDLDYCITHKLVTDRWSLVVKRFARKVFCGKKLSGMAYYLGRSTLVLRVEGSSYGPDLLQKV